MQYSICQYLRFDLKWVLKYYFNSHSFSMALESNQSTALIAMGKGNFRNDKNCNISQYQLVNETSKLKPKQESVDGSREKVHVAANLLCVFNERLTSPHLNLAMVANSQFLLRFVDFFFLLLIPKICSHVISSFLIIPYSLHLSC